MEARNLNKHYTYSDYAAWEDDTRWELVGGSAYMLAAPNVRHQRVLGNLYVKFREFLQGKPCEVFIAPCDVRINHNEEDDTVVQPDLMVVCDPSKIDEKGIKGAPELVIEILSPSSGFHDAVTKLEIYQKYGVREFWIVNPEKKTVHVYHFNEEKHSLIIYKESSSIPMLVLEGCNISLAGIFPE